MGTERKRACNNKTRVELHFLLVKELVGENNREKRNLWQF